MHAPSAFRPRDPRLLVALATLLLAAMPAAVWPRIGMHDSRPSAVVSETVVVVVSSESKVREISRLYLVDLYLGRTSRFPDGTPAEPIDQKPGSPAREAFYESYLGRSLAAIESHWSKLIFTGRGSPPRDVPDGEDVKRLVASNPRAIGYIERRLVDEGVRVVRVRR